MSGTWSRTYSGLAAPPPSSLNSCRATTVVAATGSRRLARRWCSIWIPPRETSGYLPGIRVAGVQERRARSACRYFVAHVCFASWTPKIVSGGLQLRMGTGQIFWLSGSVSKDGYLSRFPHLPSRQTCTQNSVDLSGMLATLLIVHPGSFQSLPLPRSTIIGTQTMNNLDLDIRL